MYAERSVSLNFRGFAFTLNMNATFGLFRLSIITTILRKLNYHLGHFSLHNFLVQNFLELRLWKQLLGHILCLVKSVHYPCLHVHYPVRLLFPTDRNVIFWKFRHDAVGTKQIKLSPEVLTLVIRDMQNTSRSSSRRLYYTHLTHCVTKCPQLNI